MVGLVKAALRNREQLATLRVREGVIVMETMVWPDEVRVASFGFLAHDVTLGRRERREGVGPRGRRGCADQAGHRAGGGSHGGAAGFGGRREAPTRRGLGRG